jgi:hypothetical protein
MPLDEYLKLSDWTARRRSDGKRGTTPEPAPPILQRAGAVGGYVVRAGRELRPVVPHVAAGPTVVDQMRSLRTHRRYRLLRHTRQSLDAP